MNEKDLKLEREYWLGESKKAKGIYKGNFGKANYFDVTYGDSEFTRDANGYVEFPLRGVFEIEKWHFTTHIAMKCTEEQFNGIKDKLIEMGYRINTAYAKSDEYLVTNYGKSNNCLGISSFTHYQPTVFETFNPDLFLALAAMTDKEDGIKGELWVHGSGYFYLQIADGVCPNNSRKATAQEIIEHFEKKETHLSCHITPAIGGIEWSVNIGFDACKSEEAFNKTIERMKLMISKEEVQTIPIPPTKQATLFEDRVEITDWKPKDGDVCYVVFIGKDGFVCSKISYNDNYSLSLRDGFIKRTESEAKQLVEKLKKAML